MTRCLGCGQRMVREASRAELERLGAVRQSRRAGAVWLCVGCASPYRIAGAVLPRYCTCGDAYQRDPDCPQQCIHCMRRIHPDLDHELAGQP